MMVTVDPDQLGEYPGVPPDPISPPTSSAVPDSGLPREGSPRTPDSQPQPEPSPTGPGRSRSRPPPQPGPRRVRRPGRGTRRSPDPLAQAPAGQPGAIGVAHVHVVVVFGPIISHEDHIGSSLFWTVRRAGEPPATDSWISARTARHPTSASERSHQPAGAPSCPRAQPPRSVQVLTGQPAPPEHPPPETPGRPP